MSDELETFEGETVPSKSMTFGPKPGQDIATWLWCDICNEYCAHGSLADDPQAVERARIEYERQRDNKGPRRVDWRWVLKAAEETPCEQCGGEGEVPSAATRMMMDENPGKKFIGGLVPCPACGAAEGEQI